MWTRLVAIASLLALDACAPGPPPAGPPSALAEPAAPSPAAPSRASTPSPTPPRLVAPSAQLVTELVGSQVIPSPERPDVVFALHEEGLRAIDTRQGATLWTHRSRRPAISVAAGSLGVAVTTEGPSPRVLVLDPDDGAVRYEHRLGRAHRAAAQGGVIRLWLEDGCWARVLTASGPEPRPPAPGWMGTFEMRTDFTGSAAWDECHLPLFGARTDGAVSFFVLGVQGGLHGEFDAFEIHRIPGRAGFRVPREPGFPRLLHVDSDRLAVVRAHDGGLTATAYAPQTARRAWRRELRSDQGPDPDDYEVTLRDEVIVLFDEARHVGLDLKSGAVQFAGRHEGQVFVDQPTPTSVLTAPTHWAHLTSRQTGALASRRAACHGDDVGVAWLTPTGPAALIADEQLVCWDPPDGATQRWRLDENAHLRAVPGRVPAVIIHGAERAVVALVPDGSREPRFVALSDPWSPEFALSPDRLLVQGRDRRHWAILALP